MDSAWKKRRSISLEKYNACKQNIVRSPKTAMRRFDWANVLQRTVNFARFRCRGCHFCAVSSVPGAFVKFLLLSAWPAGPCPCRGELNGAKAKFCSVPSAFVKCSLGWQLCNIWLKRNPLKFGSHRFRTDCEVTFFCVRTTLKILPNKKKNQTSKSFTLCNFPRQSSPSTCYFSLVSCFWYW